MIIWERSSSAARSDDYNEEKIFTTILKLLKSLNSLTPGTEDFYSCWPKLRLMGIWRSMTNITNDCRNSETAQLRVMAKRNINSYSSNKNP